jgi:hypothetical protein
VKIVNNNILYVDKNELPVALVIVGDHGEKRHLALRPAGKHRLGARVGDPLDTCPYGREVESK